MPMEGRGSRRRDPEEGEDTVGDAPDTTDTSSRIRTAEDEAAKTTDETVDEAVDGELATVTLDRSVSEDFQLDGVATDLDLSEKPAFDPQELAPGEFPGLETPVVDVDAMLAGPSVGTDGSGLPQEPGLHTLDLGAFGPREIDMDPLGRNDLQIVRDFDRTSQLSADDDAYSVFNERQWASGAYKKDSDVWTRERFDAVYGNSPDSIVNGGGSGGSHDADGFLSLLGVPQEGIDGAARELFETKTELRMDAMEAGSTPSEIWREGGDGKSAAEELSEEKPWLDTGFVDPDADLDEESLTTADDVDSGPLVETPVQILDPAKLDDGLEDEAVGEFKPREAGDIDPMEYVEPVQLVEVPTQVLDPAKHTVNPDWGGTDGVYTGPTSNAPVPRDGGAGTGGAGGETPVFQTFEAAADFDDTSFSADLPDLPDADGFDSYGDVDG